MLKNKKVILMGAALAAIPAVSPAATITYNYYNITVATSLAGTYSVPTTNLTGNGAAEVLTVPAGDFIRIGLEATVTNNGGAGLDLFGVGFSDSNAASSVVYSSPATAGTTLTTTVVPAGTYSFLTQKGQYDGAGGVAATGGGVIYGSFNAGSNATPTQGANAAGVASPLFSRLVLSAAASGTSVFTPIQVNADTGFLETPPQTVSTAYSNRLYSTTTDTTGVLPTLTIITTGGTATSTSTTASANKIVSLLTTAPTTYGSQIGSTIVVHGSNGSYTPGNTGANASTGTATGYAIAGTFTPATDKEIYGLKLDQNGVAIATTNTTLIAAIIADINASDSGVTASTVSATYQSIFGGGYDVLLTSTGTTPAGSNGTAYLGVDFTADTTDTGITVTEVAAVPEPATAAGVVLGAAGLLLGRRKSRITVA